jgi:PAS domain S-box-containing protein
MFSIPGYTITAKIYESAKTIVCRGYAERGGQPIVAKYLRKEYPSPTDIAKFKHQYEITKNLNIAGIVKPLGFETGGRLLTLIVEDFGGKSLYAFLKNNPLNLTEFLAIAIQLAETLGKLHQNNLIHKDIKPQNIIINPKTKQVKLTDFSLASRLSRENPVINNPTSLEGTLTYMSPEQTGRMNRAIDYRTDFYSLGVTFYEMLTGRVPFLATESMELIHHHIASQPIPPQQLIPDIPPAVGAIIMKLLAKTAEERYQSAFGLRSDLETCLTQLRQTGTIKQFSLGRHDISDKFQISQKLYGREVEIAALMAAFERVSLGATEMMLVSGFSGIGKSALVHEIHKPVVRQRGYFISGKFDQFKRDVPYAPLIQAFRKLVQQLLTEPQAQIIGWKQRILRVLGSNAQVIIEVIPEIELIVGKQPPVPELTPTESQNRLNSVFQKFISIFTGKEHPLVLFLDDLQWADLASLQFIRRLATHPTQRYLLLLGAYRENEVSATHPLSLTLDEIQKLGASLTQINLQSLGIVDINRLVADTLNCNPVKSQSLAELILQKTNGNPFFVTQFLKSLYEENLLNFDEASGAWRWDLAEIQQMPIADNVVELMIRKIQRLSPATQNILQLAACIGNEFSLAVLGIVNEKRQIETSRDLQEAIAEGLILPIGDTYKYIHADLDRGKNATKTPELEVCYRFLHDRVQQAVYSLIPDADRQDVHWRVGQLLLKNTRSDEIEEKIFDIVNHLNIGKTLLSDRQEREQLARLNLLAGRKSKSSSAFDLALKYITTGMEQLEPTCWETQYELTLSLYLERAECDYLNGNITDAETICDVILARARSKIAKADVYILKAIIYTTLIVEPKAAIAIIKAGLKIFDIDIPNTEDELSVLVETETQAVAMNLGDRNIQDLICAPNMSDSEQIAIAKLLTNAIVSARFVSRNLAYAIVLKAVNISLRYGNSNVTAFAYMSYGWTLAGIDELERAYEFGTLALKLNEKYNNIALKSRLYSVFGIFINHWKNHLSTDYEPLNYGFQSGLELGDFQWATYAAYYQVVKLFIRGEPLETFRPELQKYLEFLIQKKAGSFIDTFKVFHTTVLDYLGITEAETSCDREACLREIKKVPALYINYCLLEAQRLYLSEQYPQALAHSQAAEQIITAAFASILVPEHYFYSSLIQSALYPNLPGNEQEKARDTLLTIREKMRQWSNACPANFCHKYLLLSAEFARITGNDTEAMALYERAINSARADGFLQNEALANELAAKVFLAKDFIIPAKAHLLEAHYGYLRWGALSKVRSLEAAYPQFFPGRTVPGESAEPTTLTESTTKEDSDTLDLTTVVKASQALASEIVLEKLLETLMKIAIESAGAQRGILILEESENLAIAAIGLVEQAEIKIQPSLPQNFSQEVSPAIINYVRRTRTSLVVADAVNDSLFKSDSYIHQRQPKSILCVPIIKQAQLIGLLYLENNLITNAFTPNRLKVLEMLSSQMAISLENARFYAEMTALNAELTQEIAERKQIEERLRESEERFRVIAEAAPLPVFISRFADGKIVYANPAFGAALNLSTQDVLGRMTLDFYYDPSERQPILDQLARDGYVQNYEFRARKAQGTPFWINMSLRPLTFNGEPTILGAFSDITDRKRIEALKDEFLANTSHELRTPLYGMIGIAESLIDGVAGSLTEKQAINLANIVSSGKRLAGLVNDILDFSKLKNQDIELQRKPVDFRQIVEIVLLFCRPLVAGKPLNLYNAVPTELPAVDGDENRLQQIVYNLIGNAIKFTESGCVTVGARVLSDSMMEVTVADTGIGISPEQFAAIFQSFEQLDASISRAYGGTGLGLSITKQLVELHGGTIRVESELSRGTRMIFTLPTTAQPSPPSSRTTEEVARVQEYVAQPLLCVSEPEVSVGESRILVVDDEPINLQVISNHLSLQNYAVSQASSGREALAILEQGLRPDLIILDVMMPKMSGYEVCGKIREQFSANEMPIVMLTAKNQVSDLVEGLEAGANDYLTKPIFKNELLARIKTHLHLSKINIASGRFVPHEFLRFLGHDSIVDVRLGEQVQKEMSVLFADIRAFTALSEGMSPKENFDFINSYLSRVGPVVRDRGGFIDKYIGDAIMALFPETATDALQAAIDIQHQVACYNSQRQKSGYTPIAVGIGLHQGSLMLGTIGEEQRMESTAISSAVNLASRLEGLTKVYGAAIIISDQILASLDDPTQYHYRFLGQVPVKGKKESVAVFEVFETEPPPIKALKRQTQANFERGILLYHQQQFARAEAVFREIYQLNPHDRATILYIKRCQQRLEYPFPESWLFLEVLDERLDQI